MEKVVKTVEEPRSIVLNAFLKKEISKGRFLDLYKELTGNGFFSRFCHEIKGIWSLLFLKVK